MHERRRQPQADLISALTRVEEQGDRLTEEDLLGLCDQLLTAGHDTTRNLIGNGMLALLQNEDQLQKLRQDPSLIVSAVEELLRYDSPLQRQTRVTKEDLSCMASRSAKGNRCCPCWERLTATQANSRIRTGLTFVAATTATWPLVPAFTIASARHCRVLKGKLPSLRLWNGSRRYVWRIQNSSGGKTCPFADLSHCRALSDRNSISLTFFFILKLE
jgi:hypothetical protein